MNGRSALFAAGLAALGVVGLCAGCLSYPVGNLATAEVASDFGTYDIRRVGLVPFAGHDLDADTELALRDAFLAEFGRSTAFEIVKLDLNDLQEIPDTEAYRRGLYHPETVIRMSRRFRLDGLLVGTVTHRSPYPPQALGIELDLVASETGLPIWHGSIHIDAADARVERALADYYQTRNEAAGTRESASLTMLSPRRFARFAAHHLAQLL